VRCGGRHRRRRAVALSLPSHGLTGYLSPAVGNLSSLRVLNLTTNRLNGAIPASLGNHGQHVVAGFPFPGVRSTSTCSRVPFRLAWVTSQRPPQTRPRHQPPLRRAPTLHVQPSLDACVADSGEHVPWRHSCRHWKEVP